jgi:2-iminobutanoate/2-iminopropanoate deaminase
MSKTPIATDKAPGAIGPYSQGVTFSDLLFTSGQLPIDPATGAIAEDVKEQARVALANVSAVLEAGGSCLENVLKVTVFLDDISDFAAVNEVYAEVFDGKGAYPARSAVEVAKLPKPGAKVEIEAIGFKG